MDMDISMHIHVKSVDMDMDVKIHIHGNPVNSSRATWMSRTNSGVTDSVVVFLQRKSLQILTVI